MGDRDDEEEDYEERVMMKLVEQEEEDIDRIKEESRKRRQAILEKYKPQQSQLQSEPHSDDSGKGNPLLLLSQSWVLCTLKGGIYCLSWILPSFLT